jgi:hypothetical protein
MSTSPRLVVLALAVAAVGAAGCGETVIDTAKTEETLKSELKKEQGIDVESADCPSDVEVKAGASFTCTLILADGEKQTATLRIRNEDADLTLVSLIPSKAPGSNK